MKPSITFFVFKLFLLIYFMPFKVAAQSSATLKSTISISTKFSGKNFPLVSKNKAAGIYFDKNDALVVEKAVKAFQNDIKLVTDIVPVLENNAAKLSGYTVIIGTLGESELINKLEKSNKIDVYKVKGKWETFGITLVDHPFPNVKQALVIYGSDKRGTAYGVFELSRIMGVSPFYWWADVVTEHKKEIYITPGETIIGPPSVKYRGIFINDEDWGIQPWAAKTFETNLKDIGPKTYAKVFELLLRLKANYIWPAMHPITGAFNKYPENKLVADSFAIVTGSAHPEPLLFNNASEWDEKTMGPWNYLTNKNNILNALDKRVKGNAPYESIYTIALRGIHDAGMVNNLPINERKNLLESAINDERSLLTKNIDKSISDIPQIFVPYKEVLDIYENGLNVPEDITLVWPDDNFGYIKRLSNEKERKRKGGSGVYYHVSYLGEPHDYLWLNTTPPALMYGEMKKAYDTGADRVWILNVGDIKGCEYATKLFLDMSWDINQFSFDNINEYETQWLSSIFGKQYQDDFRKITDEYYNLAFVHKPEYMGGGIEWNNNKNVDEKISDTQFSFTHYNEAKSRINRYDVIADKTTHILNSLDEKLKPAFFQLLYYPVKGAALMNKKMLFAQQNRNEAVQHFANANFLQSQVKAFQDSLISITNQYNSLLDGKWNHMMSLKQGYTATYFEMPPTETIIPKKHAELALVAEGESLFQASNKLHQLPVFNALTKKSYYIDVYNKGEEVLTWNAKTNEAWIKLSKSSGITPYEERIIVSLDWEKVPNQESFNGEIEFYANDKKQIVNIQAFNPKNIENTSGLYVEDNGVVSINAADFSRKIENNNIKIEVINGLGIENKAVKLGNITDKVQDRWNTERSRTEYDFYTFQRGKVDVYTYALPVFSLDNDHHTRYSVSIDKGVSSDAVAGSQEYTQLWRDNVLRNFSVYKSSLYIDKAGMHTLQIYCTDPGMIIQKIVVDLGGLKKSFLGPEPTKMK